MDTLWYKAPADNWNKALPVGNGVMGAMCFGGTVIDRFQLNNDSIWWGGFRDRINPDAKENIPVIQRLIREGKIRAAEELANETRNGYIFSGSAITGANSLTGLRHFRITSVNWI